MATGYTPRHTLDNMAAAPSYPSRPRYPSFFPLSNTPSAFPTRVQNPRGCFHRGRRREYPREPHEAWRTPCKGPSTLRVPLVFVRIRVGLVVLVFLAVVVATVVRARYSTGSFMVGAKPGDPSGGCGIFRPSSNRDQRARICHVYTAEASARDHATNSHTVPYDLRCLASAAKRSMRWKRAAERARPGTSGAERIN